MQQRPKLSHVQRLSEVMIKTGLLGPNEHIVFTGSTGRAFVLLSWTDSAETLFCHEFMKKPDS